jgi:peptidoglycan/xylan/chitin deacetylase (PgdA/CDA1 family)
MTPRTTREHALRNGSDPKRPPFKTRSLAMPAVAAAAAAAPLVAPANDAFSFWKLPEEWRQRLGSTIESSRASAELYLFEKYLASGERRPARALRAYYAVKPLLPAVMRRRVHSMLVRMRRQSAFPAWPKDSSLVDLWREWLASSLAALGVSDALHLAFWPEARNCCIVLTHDVEGPAGMARMEAMADLEEQFNFRSAWNLPLAQFPIDWKRVERMRARGFEFGAHGLNHNGQLFRSWRDFKALAPRLEGLAREHGLRGFRSPSTLRQVEWLSMLDFDFDSSFADTDPYEPQPGGTCSIFPFFMGRLVELPYTLAQDHTLINLLRREIMPVWAAKARWIASLGGMILTLVHPDYCGHPPLLREYGELLRQLNDFESAWRALPSEVAAWWRRRATLSLSLVDGQARVNGDPSGVVIKRVSSEPIFKERG